jgi:hypothetical protein
MRIAVLLLGALLLAGPLTAQQPTMPDSMRRQMQQASQMMVPMMQQMAIVMMEGTLTALAKPENADKLADFTRHYYDALIKRGFTKDEALQIVMATGVPHAQAPGR